MTTPLKIVTVTGDPDLEPSVAAALGVRSDVELVLRCVDRIELLAAVRGSDLDAIVFAGAPVWLDRQAVDEAKGSGIKLIGVVQVPAEADRLAALGATLMLADATGDEIVQRCLEDPLEVLGTPAGPQRPQVDGKVIAVWGPKGSPGRTTLAIELASHLARAHPGTLLIDADGYGGDILQLLGIVEELPTIVWAAQLAAKEELNAERLAVELRRAVGNGPVVLPGIARSDLWPEISEFGLRQLIALTRASFEFSVFDVGFCLEPESTGYPTGGEGRNFAARRLVADADDVVAICRGDALGIKNFLWSYQQLRTLCDPERIRIVVNRMARSGHWDVAELLQRHTGKRPVAFVPDVPADIVKAVAEGLPVSVRLPRSSITSGVVGLAAALGGRIKPRGVLTKLGGRSG